MSRFADKIPFSIKMKLLDTCSSLQRYKIYLFRANYPKQDALYDPIPLELFERYNRARNFGPKKRFCYAPYTNLFFNTYGSALICCYNTRITLGKYPEKSLHEMWFSEIRKNFGEHLMMNDLTNGCGLCKYQIQSGRFENLKPSTVDRYANTKFSSYPAVVEFELSNQCNLECVMCSGRVSSSIRKNRDHEAPLHIPYDDNFVQQLEEFIPHIKEAKFFGGEPFLIDIYYKIWEKIITINPKCQIFLLTNGTIYNERVERVLSKLNVSLGVSFDAMDREIYESIRKNAAYDKVIANIHKFAEYCRKNKKVLGFSITPMTLNRQEIPKIVEFANSLNAIVYFSFVEKPERLALWTLNKEKLQDIVNYYRSFVFPQKTSLEKINKLRFEEIISQIEFWIRSGVKPSFSIFPDPHGLQGNEKRSSHEFASETEALEFLNSSITAFIKNEFADVTIADTETASVLTKIYEVVKMENNKSIRLELLNKIVNIGVTEAFIDEIKNNNAESLFEKARYFLMTEE